MVKKQVKTYALTRPFEECSYNRKTWHLKLETFQPDIAKVILREMLWILDLKVNFKRKYEYDFNCPFCTAESEHSDHIFIFPVGVYVPKSI